MKSNNLINEKSPYLLQHAYNPVNWYPWSDKAFERVKEEDKPIFLSIGYSTCHWCHVMEKESFEDEEVAEVLNDNFISIKVDREERPDVDSVYMKVCQAITGSGGWPLTIIMTPDKKPFFAGTYFPKYQRYNKIGIIDLLEKLSHKYKTDKNLINESTEEILNFVQKSFEPKSIEGNLDKSLVDSAVKIFKLAYDREYGGFGQEPKFPAPQNILLFLKYYKLEGDNQSLAMAEKTLEYMYRGGLFDHIGYGFSRYSTDKMWLVPHFEKMLYDNAMLIITYLEAYSITKKELYKNIAIKTIDYVIRELRDNDGGFYSAQDADSEGEEGKFYVFNPLEIIKVLGEEDAKYFNSYYGVTDSGNFEGKNILNLLNNDKFDKEDEKINEFRKKIFDYRLNRTTLHKDDKILTSWNGLMVVALSNAYKLLGDKIYLSYANDCIKFIKEKLVNKEGRLLARYRDNHAGFLAYLDDYSFLVWAYISLYESTFDIKYLEEAIKLNKESIKLFWDNKNGGFFLYGKDAEELISRPKDLDDGAKPSGNSVATYNLIKLASITGDVNLEELAQKQLKIYLHSLKSEPTGYSFYLTALMYKIYPSKEIVCVAKNKEDVKALKDVLNEIYNPNTIVIVKDENYKKELIPYLSDYGLKDNKTTYYICQNNSCSQPFNDIEKLKESIN
ncbi:thioredoxin domain-containing protein [Faecalimicrobium dakarense]|uniref:thioredoxin domain-containing protein n=1 Tax=Faecalimicrobium dakarense TaxID=1301100 RepID=UPI0004B49856|nr:thioredoxin domain-containing protein [[Clostridium] dakarense]